MQYSAVWESATEVEWSTTVVRGSITGEWCSSTVWYSTTVVHCSISTFFWQCIALLCFLIKMRIACWPLNQGSQEAPYIPCHQESPGNNKNKEINISKNKCYKIRQYTLLVYFYLPFSSAICRFFLCQK